MTLGMALAATSLGGCKKAATTDENKQPVTGNGSATGSGNAAAPTPEADNGAAAADESLGKTLNAAIACINGPSADMYTARSGYYRTATREEAPDPKKTTYIRPVTDQAGNLDKLKDAIALTPAVSDLDTAMTDYLVVVNEVIPIINDASDYYEKKANLDDAAAKGKELHPKLVAGFDKFATVAKTLSDVVGAKNRERKEAGLEKIAKIPEMHGEYLFGYALLLAEDVINLGDVPLEELDLDKLTAATTALEKKVDEVKAYAAAKTEPAIDGFSSVESSMSGYVKAAMALVRRKRDNKAFDQSELDNIGRGNGNLVEGSSGELVDRYNNLINSSNHR